MSTVKSHNFSKTCRTCLLEPEKMHSVYTSNILEMLNKCTNIKISKFDGLPQQICPECLNSVRIAYDFKLQSEKSEQFLQKIISERNADCEYESKIKSEFSSGNSIRDIYTDPNSDDFDTIDCKHETSESFQVSTNEKINSEQFGTAESGATSLAYCNVNADSNKDCNSINEKINSDEFGTAKSGSTPPAYFNTDGDKNCTCEMCNQQQYYKCLTQRHKQPEHRTKRVLCPVCNKEFFDPGNLKSHMLRHNGEKKFNCDRCAKSFYEISALAYHVQKRHDSKPVECNVCWKQFKLQIQLDLHSKSHDENRFICKTCGKNMHSNKALKAHELSHTEQDPVPCAQCDKFFKHGNSLSLHVRRCHQEDRKKNICTVCGKEVANLKQHMLLKHATETPYKCSKCNKAFAKEWFLKLHSKSHTGEPRARKELCTVCGKEVHLSGIVIHMRMHTGERPFKCQTCGKTFKSNTGLMTHKRSHTGERPYKCPVCDKGFTSKMCVKKHQVVHTGERPHQCRICNHSFGQRSTLRTHMKVHIKGDA